MPHSGGRGTFSCLAKHRQIGIRVSPVFEKLSVRVRAAAPIAGGDTSTSESEQRRAAVRGQSQCLLVGGDGLGCAPGLEASLT